MSEPLQVPVLKRESKVTITLGSRIIGDLQGALAYLVEGRTKQELDAIREHILSGNLQPWESSSVALTRLLQVIFDEAQKHDMLDYRSIEDMLGIQSSSNPIIE